MEIILPNVGADVLDAAVEFAYHGRVSLDVQRKADALPLLGGLQLLGMDEAAFEGRYVTARVHPEAGDLRPALRDRRDGACVLLEGASTCRAYAARPRRCRDFPAWDEVLEDPVAFERARELCPGIEVPPATGDGPGPSQARTFRLRFDPPGDR